MFIFFVIFAWTRQTNAILFQFIIPLAPTLHCIIFMWEHLPVCLFPFIFHSWFGWFQNYSCYSAQDLTTPWPQAFEQSCFKRRTKRSFLWFWWHQEFTCCWICLGPLGLSVQDLIGIQGVTLQNMQGNVLYARVLYRS